MRKYIKWTVTALLVLWCAVIWQFSLASAEDSTKVSGEVQEICNEVLDSAGVEARVTGRTVRKMAHFVEFFVLGLLAAGCLLAHGFPHWQLLAPAVPLPVAAIDECIQIFVPNRAPHVLDVLLDLWGGVCGTLAFLIVLWLILYIKNKREEKISKTP